MSWANLLFLLTQEMAPPNLSLKTVEVFLNVPQFRQDKYGLLSQNGPREFRSTISVHLSLNLLCSVSSVYVTFCQFVLRPTLYVNRVVQELWILL
jgi:hypothetical protein